MENGKNKQINTDFKIQEKEVRGVPSLTTGKSKPELKSGELIIADHENNQQKLEEIKKRLEQGFDKETKQKINNKEDALGAHNIATNSDERVLNNKNYTKSNAKSENITQKMTNMLSRVKALYRDVFFGSETSNRLAEYVIQNSSKTIEQLNQDLLADKKKKELQGVTEIQQLTLDNGSKSYLVKIDKKQWHSLLHGPGIALSKRGIAIVAMVVDGFTLRSEKLITDHEIYHLNHHASQVFIIQKLFRELDTVWNTNIKTDIVGSLGVLKETAINVLNVIKTIVRKYKTKSEL